MSQLSTLDAEILHSAVSPDEPTFSRPVAKAVLAIKFSERQQKEVSRLLDKNNEGTITTRELAKLESYVRVGNLLSLLKAKARVSNSSRVVKR